MLTRIYFLHIYFFYLLLALIPVQLGFHFWPDWATVSGIRVDYLSPTIFATDLLILLIVVFWICELIIQGRNWTGGWLLSSRIPYLLLYLLLIGLGVTQNKMETLYGVIKLIEYTLLGLYVYANYQRLISARKFILAFCASLVYSSLLAWTQFLLGHSVGGWAWWLGERTFSVNDPGIALVTINNIELLRPYATFPHPNALAGYLVVGLVILYRERIAFWIVGLLSAATIIITMSHGAWASLVAAGVLCLFMNYRRFWSKTMNIFLGTLILLSLSQPFLTLPNSAPDEIFRRVELARAAGKMFLDHPLTGVGLKNFIVLLPHYTDLPRIAWWFQPVHNIWLLTLAETGILGLAGLGYLFLRALKAQQKWVVTALVVVLVTGFVDHYWLTLQQSQILLSILLGTALYETDTMS